MMGKFEDMAKNLGAHADRSLGIGQAEEVAPPVTVPAHLVGIAKSKDAAEIAVGRIVPDPGQPRDHFDEESLGRLAESIKGRGVLQPIRVRWDEEAGHYVLIAGERRWRAAKLAGLESVPCVIHRGTLSAEDLLALQLIENVLRDDLSPVEQARGYRTLMDASQWSASRLARELAIPNSTVTRALELLDLPEPVQALVEGGRISPSSACEIGRLPDSRQQEALASEAAEKGLTRSAVVEAVKARKVGTRSATFAVRLDDGHKVTVTGPAADAGDEAVAEILRRAIRKIRAGSRERAA